MALYSTLLILWYTELPWYTVSNLQPYTTCCLTSYTDLRSHVVKGPHDKTPLPCFLKDDHTPKGVSTDVISRDCIGRMRFVHKFNIVNFHPTTETQPIHISGIHPIGNSRPAKDHGSDDVVDDHVQRVTRVEPFACSRYLVHLNKCLEFQG